EAKRGALAAPLAQVGDGPLEERVGERGHEAMALGHLDELGRVKEAEVGMLPAREHLDPLDLALPDRNDRLVVGEELAPADPRAQLLADRTLSAAPRPGHHAPFAHRTVQGPRWSARSPGLSSCSLVTGR